jgi:hypothetical protein
MISSSAGAAGSDDAGSGDAEVKASDTGGSAGGSATVVRGGPSGSTVEAGTADGGATCSLFAHHTVAEIAVAKTSSSPRD